MGRGRDLAIPIRINRKCTFVSTLHSGASAAMMAVRLRRLCACTAESTDPPSATPKRDAHLLNALEGHYAGVMREKSAKGLRWRTAHERRRRERADKNEIKRSERDSRRSEAIAAQSASAHAHLSAARALTRRTGTRSGCGGEGWWWWYKDKFGK